MFCPSCGSETADRPNYCRKCGANLALVGKIVTLGEAIARGDGGLLPKLKAMVGDVQLDAVSVQVGKGLDQVQRDIEKGVQGAKGWHAGVRSAWNARQSPEERRARRIDRGFSSFFSGIALTVFLYFFSSTVALRIPPDAAARIPFDIVQFAHVAWLIGLIPVMSGLGRIIAGFLVRPDRRSESERPQMPEPLPLAEPPNYESVTEATTNLLDESAARVPARESNRS